MDKPKTVPCPSCGTRIAVRLTDGPAPQKTLCPCGHLVELMQIRARRIGGLSTTQQAGPIS